MKKNICVSILVLLAAVYGFSSPRSTITLKNSTGYEIFEIYVSPADSEDWGSDYLVNTTLDDGDSFTITLPRPLSEARIYDIMFVDIDDDRYCQFDISLTNGQTIEITMDDLYDTEKDYDSE